MEKNKLGIVINTTKANYRTSGFRPIYNYNSDEWSSIVRDTGAELKRVTNNANSDPIHLIQFISYGCCYCIMKSIAGRKDYQSAWIFIHKDIVLPKGVLTSVIKKIEDILSFDVEDKKAELDNLFEKTYPTSDSPSYPVSSGDTYAVRYYDKGTNLNYSDSNVLEDYLYQSEYCNYKSVFLVNKTKGQVVADAIDLSDIKLQKSIVINLPKEIDGFKPYSGNSLITNAVRVTEGKIIAVKWKRSGYAPIDKRGKSTEELLIKKSEYKKSFRLNLFRVIDKVTKKDLNVSPQFVGNYWVDDKQNPTTIYFREDDLTRVSCHVDKTTYHSFSDIIDLTKPNEDGEYVIELQPEEHIYSCYIPTNIPDNSEIKFVIKTQYKLRGDEIPGFKFDGIPSETRNNRLKAKPQQTLPQPAGSGKQPKQSESNGCEVNDNGNRNKKKKHFPLFQHAIITLLLLVLLGGGYYLYKYFFPDEPEIQDAPVEVINNPQTEWEKAFNYLSNNNTNWTKSEMDSISELKGVYTMIKDFRFKDLKSFIDRHPDLKDLDPWNRLYIITSKYNDKRGTFKSNDDKINIEEYLKTDFDSKEDVSSPTTKSSTSDAGSSSPEERGRGVNNNATTSNSNGGPSSSSNSSTDSSNQNNWN